MGVNNSLTQRKALPDKPVEYMVNGETVKLTPNIIRQYLVSGGGNVTDQEIVFFLNMCKYQKLNPFTKDVYLVKYGSQPATMVTSIGALLKRAMRNPNYAGHQAGVVARNRESGQLEYRIGSFVLPEEDLIGGWSKVYVKGYEVPMETAVSFHEYKGTKGNGELNSMWAGKPGVMIRKVALATGLRECFPDDLANLYSQEEVDAGIIEAPMAPVDIEQPPEQQVDPVPQEAPAEVMDQRTMEELPDF